MNSSKALSVVTEDLNLGHLSLIPSVASPARAPFIYFGNAHRLKARHAEDALDVRDDVAHELAVSQGRSTPDTFL
jgi:hypothetical protein